MATGGFPRLSCFYGWLGVWPEHAGQRQKVPMESRGVGSGKIWGAEEWLLVANTAGSGLHNFSEVHRGTEVPGVKATAKGSRQKNGYSKVMLTVRVDPPPPP